MEKRTKVISRLSFTGGINSTTLSRVEKVKTILLSKYDMLYIPDINVVDGGRTEVVVEILSKSQPNDAVFEVSKDVISLMSNYSFIVTSIACYQVDFYDVNFDEREEDVCDCGGKLTLKHHTSCTCDCSKEDTDLASKESTVPEYCKCHPDESYDEDKKCDKCKDHDAISIDIADEESMKNDTYNPFTSAFEKDFNKGLGSNESEKEDEKKERKFKEVVDTTLSRQLMANRIADLLDEYNSSIRDINNIDDDIIW